jgi:hypothetical protein
MIFDSVHQQISKERQGIFFFLFKKEQRSLNLWWEDYELLYLLHKNELSVAVKYHRN